MVNEATIDGYAKAIVAIAQAEGALDRVTDELFTFARTVQAAPELRERLTDPAAPVAAKLATVEDLLGGRAHPQTVGTVLLLVQAGRARLLTEVADAVAEQASATRSRSVAEVRSAVALDEDQRTRLSQAVSRALGREVDLRAVIDPDVVGGLVVKVGDTVIDGSVARRLSELRTALTGA
jgi:F-type H+-transporting ATPase subunit delta